MAETTDGRYLFVEQDGNAFVYDRLDPNRVVVVWDRRLYEWQNRRILFPSIPPPDGPEPEPLR